MPEPASVAFIRELHVAFYADAPKATLLIEGAGRRVRVIPGKFRSAEDHEVAVGRRQPPSAAAVGSFMAHFEQPYRFEPLGMGSRILALAAAHHRLNDIHPFLDGDGRVSRLMGHAMALKAGIGAHGLWSVSRGLARGLGCRGDYKRMMDRADMPRQGDLDGRGNLSRRALREFTAWFLKVSLGHVTFMSSLFAVDTLVERIKVYVARRELKPGAFAIIEQALQRGELPRGEAARVTGLRERSARDLLASLVADGIPASDTRNGHIALRFPLDGGEIPFPNLFQET